MVLDLVERDNEALTEASRLLRCALVSTQDRAENLREILPLVVGEDARAALASLIDEAVGSTDGA